MLARVLFWLSIFVLGTTVAGQAATAVTLSPAYGHPSTVVSVSGTSFGDLELVDVYVDLVDTLLLGSSSTGSFSGSVTIPASASPGRHYITAVGRRTGDFAQTTFEVGSPWSQFGYSAAHLATNPWENTLSPSNVATIGPKWINPGGSFGGGGTVAVNFGDVYVSLDGTGIEALSTSTGSLLWSFAIYDGSYASPTLSGGVLYVGSFEGTVYALNATTGAKIWSSNLSNQIDSSAAVANGIVYVASFNDLYALNASTGKTVWTYATNQDISASPTVVNGVVYIGSRDYSEYALNASTGKLIWQFTTGGQIESTAAVANGVVYFGSEDGNVYALEAQGPSPGSLLWKYTTANEVSASPAVAGNTVFIGSQDNNLYALDAHAGSLDWSIATGGAVSSAAVANGVVYFTSANNTFYAVAATSGTILATALTGPQYLGSPSISDGCVYVTALGGSIFAFTLPPNLNTNAIRRAGPPLPASLHPDPRLRVAS